MTIARKIAEYAVGFDYTSLPQEVVHATKRALLDTVGCAIGGYASDASRIFQSLVGELGKSDDSTIIGSGIKTDCLNATMANGIMVRYLDYMDQISIPVGQWYVYTHPGEVIPSVLAVGERQHSSGKEILAAIVLGYELLARFSEANTIIPMSKKGWNSDTAGAYVVPAVAGKLLGLDAEQIENAIGISGCHGMILGILDTAAEEFSMTKNLRFPFTARDGVLAALLAQKGFTGPTTVFEGDDGFIHSVMNGDFAVEQITNFGGTFRILNTEFKMWPACGTIQGHLNATLNLMQQYNIKPEDISRVRLQAGTRSVQHTGDPVRRYPRNKETADHSAYYVTAIAILEGELSPAQYSNEKYTDPKVRQLIDKISMEINTDLDRFGRAGISEVTTRQGAQYTCRVDYPKGHPLNPMTDEELRSKFCSLAAKFLDEQQIQRLADTIFSLEEINDISQFIKLLVFKDR
ncbi:MAG: MmgE/PrpD family protein [Chloroflexota bacterium]